MKVTVIYHLLETLDILNGTAHNQFVITLEGSGCDKRKDIINFVKSQPLFDVHWQYLWTFLIDLQADVSRFRCRVFHCFPNVIKIWLNYNWFLSFISYPLVIFLHLESFEKELFELDFSISKKTCFYCQTLSGR